MCLNKLKIRHPLYGNIYVPCGHCDACRQSSANKHVSKLLSSDKSMKRYFVTLSYKNNYIPYVNRNELKSLIQHFRAIYSNLHSYYVQYSDLYFKNLRLKSSLFYDSNKTLELKHVLDLYDKDPFEFFKFLIKDEKLRVYRNASRYFNIDKCHDFGEEFITFDKISNYRLRNILNCSFDEIDKIHGLQQVFKPNRVEYYNKIAVNYTADWQKFFKRLAFHFCKEFGKDFRFKRFGTPEYGPSTNRSHFHFILFVPSEVPFESVRRCILAAWPFCDKKRLSDNIEVARAAEHYTASYVNLGSDGVKVQHLFSPLRRLSSLFLGDTNPLFNFGKVFSDAQNGLFCYTYRKYTNGIPSDITVPYPKFVTSRYFPIFKGFGRLASSAQLFALSHPREYFKIGEIDPRSIDLAIPVYRLDNEFYKVLKPNCDDLINKELIDPRTLLSFTKYEINSAIRRIDNAYNKYFKPLGYSRQYFAEFVQSYWKRYQSFLLRDSLRTASSYALSYAFFNIDDHLDDDLDNINDLLLADLEEEKLQWSTHYNFNPVEVSANNRLSEIFNDNIKHRHINECALGHIIKVY